MVIPPNTEIYLFNNQNGTASNSFKLSKTISGKKLRNMLNAREWGDTNVIIFIKSLIYPQTKKCHFTFYCANKLGTRDGVDCEYTNVSVGLVHIYTPLCRMPASVSMYGELFISTMAVRADTLTTCLEISKDLIRDNNPY